MKHLLAHSKWQELSHYCIIKQCNIPNKLQFLHRKVHQTVKMMGIVHSNAWHREDQTVVFFFWFFFLLQLRASFFIPLSTQFLAHGLLNELWTDFITFLLMFLCRPKWCAYPQESVLLQEIASEGDMRNMVVYVLCMS